MQLRREMRIRMYDVLLPKLIEGNFHRTDAGLILPMISYELPAAFIRTVVEVERASIIAGRADSAKAKQLRQLVFRRQNYHMQVKVKGSSEDRAEIYQRMENEGLDIGEALFELNDYLARKLV